MTEEEALHIAMLPDPDAAVMYLNHLETGVRPSIAARRSGLTEPSVNLWRKKSSVFDAMCSDAEAVGVGVIDDVVLNHVKAGTPGWSGAAKLILQRRDRAYGEKHELTGANGTPLNIDGLEVEFIGAKK